MVKARGKSGEGRMDAAIDHFVQMGYSKADIRRAVNKLRHKDLYGKDGWPLLEENCYYVVQEHLLEMEQKQEQQQDELEVGVAPKQLEAPQKEAPLQTDMRTVEVHNEVLSKPALDVEKPEELVPMIINPSAPKDTLPPPADTETIQTRGPCYGWISDSDSDLDSEEQPADQQYEVYVPSPGVDLLCKRKRLSRWDVREAA